MGRKRTLNYRELRSYDEEEGGARKDEEDVEDEKEDEDEDEDKDEDEDEEAEDEEGAAEGEGDEEEVVVVAKPKKKKPAPPPKPAKPKRSRAAKVVRLRIVWGVYNNSNQRVATFEYPRKQEAVEHAAKLSTDKKQTFFVQPIREPIEEK
jgi:hypothetical protein